MLGVCVQFALLCLVFVPLMEYCATQENLLAEAILD